MPFIPHTDTDVRDMLATIGVPSIDALFDEIPASLRGASLAAVPEALTEMDIARLMQERATQDGKPLNFIGAGAYEHHIPAAVWSIVTRGEFYSAYTPYQAEASQGTLQLLYEYQTMIASLTGMQVANASLYDGASAVAEAALMAVRAHRRSTSARILMPTTLNPIYRQVTRAIAGNQALNFEMLPYVPGSGTTDATALDKWKGQDVTALVIQQPNFFGQLEDVDALTDWAHANGALVIAVVNPTSLALLKPPGEWGQKGVDIVVGEGQPLGVPLAGGGPYFGFMTTRMEYVRSMPGRIVGRTARSRRQARLHADAAGPRAAHPPHQGYVEHLHEPGIAGHRRDDLPVDRRPRRAGAGGGREPGPHARTGGGAHEDPRRAHRVRRAAFP